MGWKRQTIKPNRWQFGTGLASVSLSLGLLVILGWQLDILVLKTIYPGYISMKANTAMCIILFSFAAGLLNLQYARPVISFRINRTLVLICVSLAGLVGVLTLIEYTQDIDLKIDQLLYKDVNTGDNLSPPGRLAPVTAMSLIGLMLSVWMSHGLRKPWWRTAQLCLFATFLLSFQAVVSYLLGVHSSFGIAPHTRIALHTAICFILISTSVLISYSQQGFMKTLLASSLSGSFARSMMLAAIFVPPVVQYIELWCRNSGWFDPDFGTLLRIVGSVLFFVIMVWRNSERLYLTEQTRELAMADLRRQEIQHSRLVAEARVSEAVQKSEARLRAIFAASLDAIVGLDKQGLINDWSPQATRIFGWQVEEVRGKNMGTTLIEPISLSSYEKELSLYLTHSVDHSVDLIPIRPLELHATRRNGESFQIEFMISLIRVDQDTSIIAFIRDISERKKIELDLIAARQKAIEGARVKAEFLANMSHEIRTPMNGIIGVADLLSETQLNEEQRKYARIIQSSGNSLLTIVNDILDFSKIEAGKLIFEKVNFNLKEVVESQLQVLHSKAEEKGLSLISYIDPAILPTLKGDPGRIGQILLNLIGNAIKFTEKGSVMVRVEPALRYMIKFSVTDTGIGIDELARKRLFIPFSQADGSTARKYGGTGLGLSICRKLVEMSGGSIDVESQPGQGSTFWFTCSFDSTDAVQTISNFSTKKESRTSSPKTFDRATKRILIAEDNLINQFIVSTMLTDLGYAWVQVENGIQALRELKNYSYDLILMDCQMPELDGFETTRAIREAEKLSGSHILILALTANAMAEDVERCYSSGMDGFLSKPIKKEKLAREIESLFNQAEPPKNRL